MLSASRCLSASTLSNSATDDKRSVGFRSSCRAATAARRINYTRALYEDPDATLDDLREAETTLVETERTARRILGSAHPLVDTVEQGMRDFRELRAIHELRASIE